MVAGIGIFYLLAVEFIPEDYGLYAAAIALFMIIGAFVTLGTSHIVAKRISQDASTAASSWGAALLPGILLSFVVAGVLAVFAGISVPGLDGKTIFLLGLAEFLGSSISVPAAFALQALDRFPAASVLTATWAVMRMGFVGYVVYFVEAPSLVDISIALLVASLLAGVSSSAALLRVVGPPKFSRRESVQICKDGFPFSLTQASGALLGDIDKQMLLRFDVTGEYSAGIYSAGNRVLGLSAAPMYAVLAATYPRYFAKGGESGLRGTWGYSKRLLLPVGVYAALAGGGLFLVAPLIDNVLSGDYVDTISVIRWMSLVPLIHMPGLLAAEALTGAGFQQTRNKFIIGAGLLNGVLNFALIGQYGINGAIIATYSSELFLLGGLLVWIKRKLATL